MSKSVAIIQSNYIPWKGYFDVIDSVDEFILLDEVQFTKRDWRNRNRIKSPAGVSWLSIPVQTKGKYTQRIDETLIGEPGWAVKHWRTISQAYAQARGFSHWRDEVAALYDDATFDRLSEVNHHFLTGICRLLGIDTPITWSTDYSAAEGKNERLIDLCVQTGASSYLSGPAARDYIDIDMFEARGIAVEFVDYGGYPEYEQLGAEFTHGVTVLDVMFNTGAEANRFVRRDAAGALVLDHA